MCKGRWAKGDKWPNQNGYGGCEGKRALGLAFEQVRPRFCDKLFLGLFVLDAF